MNQDQARKIITDWIKIEFGNFLEVREIKTVRKATGRVWTASIYCSAKEGDIFAGEIIINELGKLLNPIDTDKMIDALVMARTSNSTPPINPFEDTNNDDDFGSLSDDMDFSDLTGSKDILNDDDVDFDSAFDTDSIEELQTKANELIITGEQEKLMEARDILPRLLVNQEMRGQVLQQMAELEFLLGELDMGTRHLEGAAREYADMANLEGLAVVADLATQIMTDEQFEKSPIRSLFDHLRNRLRPLNILKDAPLFVGLGDEELFALEGLAKLVKIEPGDTVLKEGAIASEAFIIKSGTLSIRVEEPDGGIKIIRSSFPGDFIGESSIIGKYGATCTASVIGETFGELWQFDGQAMRLMGEEYPEILMRVESAKTLHQLDSFISMNESTESLDVSMRDKLLSCITGMARVPKGEVLNSSGDVPANVHLIVSGTIEYKIGDQVSRVYEADQFAGLRDTLHELPLEGNFISATDCLLVIMDTEKLKKIADKATPEVIAVLEKLE
ncbi:MAG: cyclic nucleotide-binding domain-containing protein [Deltaproteobacteria bacterium]|nr:cyclic nucleotide-binding domain-containing protein [Deltaproteobacteria bacterium]